MAIQDGNMSNKTALLYDQCQQYFYMHGRINIPVLYRDMAEYAQHFSVDIDRYGEGEFLNGFEGEIARLLGKEAAVFMPSGVMAQQIALRIRADQTGLTRIAYHPTSHLEINEYQGYRFLHGLQASLLGERRRLVEPDDFSALDGPASSLLLELPQRWAGGLLPEWRQLGDVIETARQYMTYIHLDGARLWECLDYYSRENDFQLSHITQPFDSAYVSFYKTLGGIGGAMLVGDRTFINDARIWLRRQGGNLYQLHPMVIAAHMGMDRHLPHIPAYVKRAQMIAELIKDIPKLICYPEQPRVNMLHIHFAQEASILEKVRDNIAKESGIWVAGKFHPSYLGRTDDLNSFMEIHVGESLLNTDDQTIYHCLQRLASSDK